MRYPEAVNIQRAGYDIALVVIIWIVFFLLVILLVLHILFSVPYYRQNHDFTLTSPMILLLNFFPI